MATTKEKQINRGSEWRKWDLHIHSPKTFLANEYNGCSIDDFVNEIEAKGIAVVGLTNYFHFADNELDEIRKKLEGKGIVVFPNLEFRTQPKNKDNEEMHTHIVFSDKLPKTKIEGFLGRLKMVDDKYCKDLTTEEIKTTSIAFDTLKSALEQDKEITHLDDYIIVACPRGDGSYRPSSKDDGRGNNLAVVIDKKTDALFGKKDDVEFFLKTDRYESAVQKPVFLCSDAHNKAGIGSGFTWIKSDITFDGLKQTLYEPVERVRIQERNPGDSKTERVVIDRVTYKHVSGTLDTVYFNRDLNSIIGIRGSGKSTLLKNLAQKIDPSQFAEKDKKAPYPLSAFNVEWADGQKNSGTDESPKSIFYVPQNYLSSLAYDDGDHVNERDGFLTTLLKKNTRFANAIQSFESFVSKNKVKIEELIQKLLTADKTARETELLLKKQGSQMEIDGEVKKKNEQIKKYKDATESGITDSEIKSYSEAQKAVVDGNKAVDILKQDKEILTSLKKTGADIFISDQEFSLLSSARQELIRKELTKTSKKSLEALITSELANIDNQIEVLNKVIKEKSGVVKVLEEKIKKSKALDDLTKELAVLQQTQDKIKELSAKLKKAQDSRMTTIDSLADAYADFEHQQDSIYKTIKFDEKFSFLKVEIISKYNTQQLKTFIERNVNTRDSDSTLKLESDIKALFGDSPEKLSKETAKKVITGLIDGRVKIKVEATDVASVISQLLRNRYEIDYLNSVKTQNGDCFKDMTGGQKAIALLELIFRFDDEKYPILIDQPEDDLDVGGVATDLVNFIKSEKQERQIIVVTHNASLVVCSDTEEVLVSDIKRVSSGKYDFTYGVGAIENPERRNDIIRVLEGGDTALRKRMLKLNLMK